MTTFRIPLSYWTKYTVAAGRHARGGEHPEFAISSRGPGQAKGTLAPTSTVADAWPLQFLQAVLRLLHELQTETAWPIWDPRFLSTSDAAFRRYPVI